MSSFIKKTKKKTKTIQDLTEDETQLVLKQINTAKLDKEYAMSEINKFAERKMITLTFVDENDVPIEVKPEPEIKSVKQFGTLKKPLKAPLRVSDEPTPTPVVPDIVPPSPTVTVPRSGKGLFKSNLKNITTHLGEIGISNEQKPKHFETMIKSEHISVKLYSCCNETNQKKEIQPKTDVNCWWCRFPVPEDVHPLGCPVKYIKSKGGEDDYFETDGIFCSFNCVMAYINIEMRYNVRYRESGCLLYLLYKFIYGKEYTGVTIHPAVDWRLLKKYGGCFTIQEFRSKFQTVSHFVMNQMKVDRKLEKNPLNPTGLQYVEEENNKKLY